MSTDDPRLLAHRTDPDTSHQAAEQATHRPQLKATLLLLLLRDGPQTAFELRETYMQGTITEGWPRVQPHSVDRRLSELVRDELVIDSGQRRQSPWGRAAVVWELPPIPDGLW